MKKVDEALDRLFGARRRRRQQATLVAQARQEAEQAEERRRQQARQATQQAWMQEVQRLNLTLTRELASNVQALGRSFRENVDAERQALRQLYDDQNWSRVPNAGALQDIRDDYSERRRMLWDEWDRNIRNEDAYRDSIRQEELNRQAAELSRQQLWQAQLEEQRTSRERRRSEERAVLIGLQWAESGNGYRHNSRNGSRNGSRSSFRRTR